MQWISEAPEGCRISQLNYRIQDNQSVLTWLWPEGLQLVYVYRFAPDSNGPGKEPENMKLYTREEYKANAGYWERLEGIGRQAYRVYPCLRLDSGIAAVRQEDDDNLLLFCTGKVSIRYSIKYGQAFFGRMKPARIEIVSEAFVPKEALCYVKKEGGVPLHRDDGTVFPFIRDMAPGRNLMPLIEISKSSKLRIFFTDGKKYGDIYELIPV